MKLAMKKIVALLAVALLMTDGAALTAQAASAKATTLKLEATEGEVAVENARGRTLSAKDGTKLYSGYQVSTGRAGYAWISLDQDMVVKLDESSSVTVKQVRRKLEIMLESGNLFFNVSRPLADDESLNIRTSTMSTGIRGTSGAVSVDQSVRTRTQSDGRAVQTHVEVSKLVVYEGEVTVTYEKPQVAQQDEVSVQAPLVTASVAAGWQAEVVKAIAMDPAETPEETPPISEEIQAKLQPISVKEELASTGFVAVEIMNNEALREKLISGENDLDVAVLEEISAGAQEQLAADQQLAQQEEEEQQAALEEVRVQVEEQAQEILAETQSQTGQQPTAPAVIPVFEVPKERDDSPPPPPPPVWTVSFVEDESAFGMQRVTDGQVAVRPSLQPTQNGTWQLNGVQYVFTTPVTADLELTWVATE